MKHSTRLTEAYRPTLHLKPCRKETTMHLQCHPSPSTSTTALTRMKKKKKKKTTCRPRPSQRGIPHKEPLKRPRHLPWHHPASRRSWRRPPNPRRLLCHHRKSQPRVCVRSPAPHPRSPCAYPRRVLFRTVGQFRIEARPPQTVVWDLHSALPAQPSRHPMHEARCCCRRATHRSTGPTCRNPAKTCLASTP